MVYIMIMNWHEVLDRRNRDMDQVIASVLRKDPSTLQRVVAWIEGRIADPDFSIHSKDALQEWLEIIRTRGLGGVLEILDDQGEDAARMRQSSPFGILMPQEERLRILRRYETLRPRAHPAGV
jgi:hypothetical protein